MNDSLELCQHFDISKSFIVYFAVVLILKQAIIAAIVTILYFICHCAYKRMLFESLRQRVRRRYRGCGPGPSQELGGRGSSYHNLPDQLPRSHGLLTK